MFGKVRCRCGRFMRYVGHSLATYVSGGTSEYECKCCGAKVYFYTRPACDDELACPPVLEHNTMEAELEFDYAKGEWRVVR